MSANEYQILFFYVGISSSLLIWKFVHDKIYKFILRNGDLMKLA